MIRGSSGESSLSPIMSPVFKSDAAKEIIQEVGVGTTGHRKILRRSKKRSMTITSSHPAMLEALQNHNEKVTKNCILMLKGHIIFVISVFRFQQGPEMI